MPITEAHVSDYLRHGYVVVENLLAPDALSAAQQAFGRLFPSWETYKADPSSLEQQLRDLPELNLHGPFKEHALNRVAAYPDLVAFARRVIGTTDVTVKHSQINAKYFGVADYDQLHHLDFGMHTLAYPRDDGGYHILACIVYYSDVTETLGPTRILSRELTGDRTPFEGRTGKGRSPFGGSNLRWQLGRDDVPELYARERPVIVPAGGALLYNIQTFHRGSAFTGEGARFVHFINYYASQHAWSGLQGWGRFGPQDGMQTFLVNATPEERQLVNFPPPGDPYWNEATLRGVAARYPDMDMTPYRRAFEADRRHRQAVLAKI